MISTTEQRNRFGTQRLLDKWNRYVDCDVNEYSSTSEWQDAQQLHIELFKHIPDKCERVLDLGCGDGWSTYQLGLLGKHAIGVTTNKKEADHAQRTYSVDVHVEDMHDLKFENGSFDFVYCREVLEHSVAPYIALCEMNRVLIMGGYALINLPWEEWIRDDSHFSVMTPSQMREMFYKTNFIVQEEGRSSAGHYWYLARKVAEIGEKHPFAPPKPGSPWLVQANQIDHGKDEEKPKRILGMLRIKNEEKWIGKVLEQAAPIVDGFVILDDGSTDRTPDICRESPKLLRYEMQHETTVDEVRDKNKLLQMTLSYDPGWILALDGDEVLEDAARSAIPRLIELLPEDVNSVGFDFLYMWDKDNLYRFDGKYRDINHPRLFKVKGIGIAPGTLRFVSSVHGSNFHCGSVPSNIPGRSFESDITVKHYGYFEKEQREAKKEFYVRHDPTHASAGYYDHLTGTEGLVLMEWLERPAESVRALRLLTQKPMMETLKIENLKDVTARFSELPSYYRHLRKEILDAVPKDAVSILDVGCGAGVLGKALREQNPGRSITGVELNQEAYFFAKLNLDRAYNTDVESFSPEPSDGKFDCVIFADILEHLKDPWSAVKRLANYLKPGAAVIVSIPNIRNLRILQNLGEMGTWKYEDEGILDRTHLRFFTKNQFIPLLNDAGIDTQEIKYLGGDNLRGTFFPGPNGTVKLGNLELHNVSRDQFDELRAFQIMFIGRYHPIRASIQSAMEAPENGRSDGALLINENEEKQRIDVEQSIASAEHLIQTRSYDRAEIILDRILSAFPFNIDALNDLAVVEILTGKIESARKALHTALEIAPNNSIALGNLKIIDGPPGDPNHGSDGPGSIPEKGESSSPVSDPGSETKSSLINGPLVSIIIPVFNQVGYTKQCVSALLKNVSYPNYEVIIFDNASTDGTTEYLDELTVSFPRFRVIHSTENFGFVKACNIAAGQAKGKYIVFLNNDTVVQPLWLSSLVEFAEAHSDCGAVGSKLVYPDGSLQEAGGIILSDGSGRNYGRGCDPGNPAYNYVSEVDYCSGASLLVRTELFSKYGGFDERYAPAYSEDADLCFTLRMHNHKVFFCPESVVVHYESITSGKEENSGFKKYLEINRKKFTEKWKDELLLQDEIPFEGKFVPTTSDRGRLLDKAGFNKFGYRKKYVFDGLSGFPDDTLSCSPAAGSKDPARIRVNMFYDSEFLLSLVERYTFEWLVGRTYLEGRSLLIHKDIVEEKLSKEVQIDLSQTGQLLSQLEPQLSSIMKDILTLELAPEPNRSLLFIKLGGRTIAGTEALKELYKVVARYALLRGASDITRGVPEYEGIAAIEEVVTQYYTCNIELPLYVNGSKQIVRRFTSSTEAASVASAHRPKVLCFYPHNPYPPRTGADHGFLGVLDALHELSCDVSFFSSTYFTDKPWKVRDVEKLCHEKELDLFVHQADEEDVIQISLLRLMGPSKKWDMKIPDNLRAALAEVCAEVSPDIVLINYAWWGRLIDGLDHFNGIKVLQMHDLLSLNEKMQEAAHGLVGRPPYDPKSVDPAALIEDVFARLKLTGDADEYEIYNKFDFVLAVSNREKDNIRERAPGVKTVLIPAPLGNKKFASRNTYDGKPLFAIANNVFNAQAYMYFVRKVLPLVKKEIPDFQLDVVGDGCKSLKAVEGINLMGFVEDLTSLYEDSCFAVAPMLGGTGQSVKILEAMANGLAVVSLKNSYQSSTIRNELDGFIASDANEFAGYVISLYKDRQLCRDMGSRAKESVRDRYSSRRITESLEPVVRASMEKRERRIHEIGNGRSVESSFPREHVNVDLSTEAILKEHVEKEEGKFIFLDDSIFGLSEKTPLVSLGEFLNSLPPYYAHFGGIGDASLLLSTFYDEVPEQTVVSFGNSPATMKSFFQSFDKLKRVYLIKIPVLPAAHQAIRFMIHRTGQCKGMGTTPLYGYGVEWHSNVDIFSKYGVKKNPCWIDQFKTEKIRNPQITIQPKGSLKGMVGSKQNVIDKKFWHGILKFLVDLSIEPVLIGTPDERREYPALAGCVDERSYDLKRHMEIVASSDIVIGSDSWAKTLSALCSIPAIVFRTVRGKELENWEDPADNLFIKPWPSVRMVRDMAEFETEFIRSWSSSKWMTVPRDRRILQKESDDRHGNQPRQFTVTWEGSQFVHHSMALINREITLQLIAQGHDVSIIPYEKDEYGHRADRRYGEIARRINKRHNRPVDIHVRHQWPPNLVPPAEGHWVMIQPWEFGSMPKDWIKTMNSRVDEVWAPSTFVRDCYIRSGLDPRRVFVVPNGVNVDRFNPHVKPYRLKTRKKFKFLFVGGTISRKGIDVLVNTYSKTFSRNDDVCLVIKDLLGDSFYKGQTIESDLKRLSENRDLPEIEYINEKLSEEGMAGLYNAADCLVHPYRGEGFGLPIAEALACELPVIMTGYGAALDFCNEDNAYLIPARIVYYEEKRVGTKETVDYPWLAEPDPERLAELMEHVVASYGEAKEKARKGREIIESGFSWKRVGEIVEKRIATLTWKPIVRFESAAKTSELPAYRRAHELLEAGKVSEAAEELEELLAGAPSDADVANDLGVVYAMLGRDHDAEKTLENLLAVNPGNYVAKKNLASVYAKRNRIEEAVKLYDQILCTTPFDLDVLNSLGKLCVQSGQLEQAKEFFSIVLQKDSENPVALRYFKGIGFPAEQSANA